MELAPQAADADLATASRFSVGELFAARPQAPLRLEVSFIRYPRPSSFPLGLGQARLQHSAGASRRKPSVHQAVLIDKKNCESYSACEDSTACRLAVDYLVFL
jgi:hypothetical protein